MIHRAICVLTTLLAFSAAAEAQTLRLDPKAPPIVLEQRGDLAPGAVRLFFESPRPVEVDAMPAAVVMLRGDTAVPQELAAAGRPLGRSERSWLVPARSGENGLDVAMRWVEHPAVVTALPDLLLEHRSASVEFDDPRYDGQWYMELLEMELLYEQSLGSADTRVAVIDSAIELSHPDLADAFMAPYDAFDDDEDPSPNPGEDCYDSDTDICDEHGTAVAGIVGARANNGEGIVGFCPECTLIPIKMLGEGMGATSRDIAAFEHAIDNDAAVINNSWGYVESIPVPSTLAEVIRRADAETRDGLGAVVVFAAGNDDRVIENDEMEAMPEVLCISATDRYGLPTAYTNSGDAVDVAAPSATVTTSYEGGYTETFGGTSAAAPVVSGVAGWVLSYAPELTSEEVRELFVDTALESAQVTHDEDGHHQVYGYGELNPVGILDALYEEPADDDDSADDDDDGGCACQSSGSLPTAPLPLLVLIALMTFRARARS